MSIKIADKEIGNNNPAFIVAELSCNHGQNFDIAVKTIKAMKESGADAVKFATDSPDGLTLNSKKEHFQIKQGTVWDGMTLYELYQQTDTPWEWQPKLKKIAEELGLICFSTPCDAAAADFLGKEMDVPAYKIASFEITDYNFIEYVAKKGKPIIIATGIALEDEIRDVVNICHRVGNKDVILLKCTSSYPATPKEMNLLTIPDMKERFKVEVGLSDHSLSPVVPITAVALGAKLIEKHFILDRKMGGPDSSFSLEPAEFKKMVSEVREAEQSLGKVTYSLSNKSKTSRQFSRSLFVSQNIGKGEVLTRDNIKSVRPGFGLHPKYFNDILGKVAKSELEKGTPLNLKDIK